MATWAEKLAEAREWAEKAKEAESRKDWVDALACLDKAHGLALGNDFRDVIAKDMRRVEALVTATRR
jgi:hypothetical protein